MSQFEVGKKYEPCDSGMSPIKILTRTAKTCLVVNDEGHQWRMRIRDIEGDEMMIDSSVPKKWRGAFTYYSMFEYKE